MGDICPNVLLISESPLCDLLEQLCLIASLERHLSADHLVSKHTKTPYVAWCAIVLLLNDFRGDIIWGPDEFVQGVIGCG
jgi:hypothetical protein